MIFAPPNQTLYRIGLVADIYGVAFTRLVPPNVKDEPRPWLARAVLLGARIVTAMVVGSGALLGIS